MESQNDTTTTDAQSEKIEALEDYELTQERAEELVEQRGESPYGHHSRCMATVTVEDGEVEISKPYWLEGGQHRIDAPDGHLFDLAVHDNPTKTAQVFREQANRELLKLKQYA